MNAYLLAGIAMVLWGVAPIFGKLGLGGMHPLAALTIRSVMTSIILLIMVTALGKWGNVMGVAAKDAIYIMLEGVFAALLGQLAYYYALKYGEVGRVAPIVAAFPLVALVLGAMFLGEELTLTKVVAATLIFSGIVLLKF
ncbi:hypothetical protein SPSIL_006970 [Sporomusa silvacetica DSM 10669]|uniref:EamA domain-containing protein n=1 Tax=Sporomusa silvacetica DSM 10669 TaxID=1123289 RepID=A0ABZ3IFY6_9FIRM|nr:EamA family transporter [Sporomusa silvacetica]OZC16449.1 EamA-like transporter family protein [Sporomusa silvacetica DSM 10669]